MKHLLIFAFLVAFSVNSPASVRAISTPDFPTCPNPGASLVTRYESGLHGIVGLQNLYSGSDSVYNIDDLRTVQCFCAVDGKSGIQTNWWKISSLSQEEIDSLTKAGWFFVPNGADWGLQTGSYLAINYNVSRTAEGGDVSAVTKTSQPGPTTCSEIKPPSTVITSQRKFGSQVTLSWMPVTPVTHYAIYYGTKQGEYQHPVVNTGNVTSFSIGGLDKDSNYYFSVRAVNNCVESDPSANSSGGQVLGASTSFAGTGNASTILTLTSLGLILAGLSIFIQKRWK